MPESKRHRIRGRCLGNVIKTITKNPFVRNFGKMALKELSNVYCKVTNKVNNKNLKKILNLYFANSLIDNGNTIWYKQIKLRKNLYVI